MSDGSRRFGRRRQWGWYDRWWGWHRVVDGTRKEVVLPLHPRSLGPFRVVTVPG